MDLRVAKSRHEAPPFVFVPDSLSHDTVELLEHLLKEAKDGKILGVAFVAMYRRRRYIADTSGEAHRNPTFARGMVAALDDHLSDLTRGRL